MAIAALISPRVDRGETITTDAENDLLRFEEGLALITPDGARLAWVLWFRSLGRGGEKHERRG